MAEAASPRGGDDAAHAAAADDSGLADDDAETIRLDDVRPPPSSPTSPGGSMESESGEESQETSDEEVDMPNVAAGSNGAISDGLTLQALMVGPMPPDPVSSPEHAPDVEPSELITPPPKRALEGVADESSMKCAKIKSSAAAAPLPDAEDVSWLTDCGAEGL